MKKKDLILEEIILPSFSTDDNNVKRWRNVKFNESEYQRYYLDDIDQYCDHLIASFSVSQWKKNSNSSYPRFLVEYFAYLYPTAQAYEHVLELCYEAFVQPYIQTFLIYPTRDEIEKELKELERKVTQPTNLNKDDFTSVSEKYIAKTLSLINKRKSELEGKLSDEIEREYERQLPDEVQKHRPLSFLFNYISWFYKAEYLLWSNELSSRMTIDKYLLPRLQLKQQETIKSVLAYLRKSRSMHKEIVLSLDQLYSRGLDNSIPPEYLNVFWHVLQAIKKHHPHVKYPDSIIVQSKPFFTDKFFEDTISLCFTYDLEEEQPLLTGITKDQLRNIIYGNFTGKPEFQVGCNSWLFYFYLANCIAKEASFTGGQLEKQCKITMLDGRPFTDNKFRRGLSGLGIRLSEIRKGWNGKDIACRYGLQYEQIQQLFT